MEFTRACEFYPCPRDPGGGGFDRVVIFRVEQVMGGVEKTPFVTSRVDAQLACLTYPEQWSPTP
jgi:hypothetical protein